MTITLELFFHSALVPFHLCVATIFMLIIAETILSANFIRSKGKHSLHYY